ncbi:MAG: Rne/Rng family ribonuclease [Flavobacteriales bacterium]|nr:Rne/Rng family ribonuclease [Flavobacteriales bacterium]MCB9334595.1 Rne/Rng family ribonuclease [Flavobacteriales bacterium]
MSVDLIIDSSPREVLIAILRDNRLLELHKEKNNNNFSVGDIYLAKVKKIMPGLNATFVNVGYERDAFLHYLDLGPKFNSFVKYTKGVVGGAHNSSSLDFDFEPEIDKTGKIEKVLKTNDQILVQIAKEPISTKGPRLSSEISIAGRYLVLVPFSDKVSVSQKIKDVDERERLVRLIKSIKPKGFGVIVRTVAKNKKVADLHADMNDLTNRWELCFQNLQNGHAPKKVLGELDRTSALLRDLLNNDFNNIHVNDEHLANEIKTFLKTIAPDKEKIVKNYTGKMPIFDNFGVEKQIKSLFGRNVTLKSGVYLIIEHTEALHVIDVNSGQRGKKKDSTQEQNALEVNLEAAEEIARQLRLRDMGGIVVVDFIDMKEAENRHLLYEKMKEFMKDDRAKHNILPPSKFGLVQITRQRVRPEMEIKTAEKCPCCGGSGEVHSTILLVDEIENNLRYITQQYKSKKLQINVHPYVEAYINKRKGFFSSLRKEWEHRMKCSIEVVPTTAYSLLEYRFIDVVGDEILF